MKILVTGGAGFIGSNFIRHLMSAHPDYHVINLDKITYAGNLENLNDIESSPNYSFVKGDICDRQIIEGIDVDAIVNFAAESHVDRSILKADPFIQTNVIGTNNLLEYSKNRGCTFLHVSTDEVYGSIEKGLFSEDSPLLPNSPYAASKASSDLLVRSYVETYGVKAIVTRCSNNYGPYQFPEKLLPLVILNAVSNKPIPVYGDGKNVRDWIHVSDHCKALDIILHQGRPGGVYNIGSRNEKTNISTINLVLNAIAEKLELDEGKLNGLITFVNDRPGHDRRYALDPARVEKEFGWKPEMDFEAGISDTVGWYLDNKQWWQRIISGEYAEYYKTQYGESI